MRDCKTTQGLIENNFRLYVSQCPQTKEEKEYMRTIPYANAVGILMFAMICNRPDLAYDVSMGSMLMSNPGRYHWHALKWITKCCFRSSQ